MIIEAEFRVPAAPPLELREAVMTRAPKAGEQPCPACGVDRFHLLDALLDTGCWENRALAISLVRGCRTCHQEVAAMVAEARVSTAAGRTRQPIGVTPTK